MMGRCSFGWQGVPAFKALDEQPNDQRDVVCLVVGGQQHGELAPPLLLPRLQRCICSRLRLRLPASRRRHGRYKLPLYQSARL